MVIVAGPEGGVGVGLGPGVPPPTPAQPVNANNAIIRTNKNGARKDSDLDMTSHTSGNKP